MIPQWIEYSLVNLSVSTPLSYVLGMAGFTPLQGTGNFPFVWMWAKSVFLSPRPRYLNTSVEVFKYLDWGIAGFKNPRSRYLNTSTEVFRYLGRGSYLGRGLKKIDLAHIQTNEIFLCLAEVYTLPFLAHNWAELIPINSPTNLLSIDVSYTHFGIHMKFIF